MSDSLFQEAENPEGLSHLICGRLFFSSQLTEPILRGDDNAIYSLLTSVLAQSETTLDSRQLNYRTYVHVHIYSAKVLLCSHTLSFMCGMERIVSWNFF